MKIKYDNDSFQVEMLLTSVTLTDYVDKYYIIDFRDLIT